MGSTVSTPTAAAAVTSASLIPASITSASLSRAVASTASATLHAVPTTLSSAFASTSSPLPLSTPVVVAQQQPQQQQKMLSGPPYPPTTAGAGGVPTIPVDVPICAVFMLLFIGLGAAHMALFKKNLARGHKFIPSAALFGFCMSRLVACILRIVWACYPTNVSVSIAANVFINVGILIVYIINNIFVQRMVRATIPALGWNPVFRTLYKVFLFLVAPIIIMIIVTLVQSFYTLDEYTRYIDRSLLLFGLTYLLMVAAMPLYWLTVSFFVPLSHQIDEFGVGNWFVKGGVVFLTTAMSCLEAGFRTGSEFMPERPLTQPAWFDGKAAFYCFSFVLDVLVVLIFLVARVDLLFWVPNGANGSYGAPATGLRRGEKDSEETMMVPSNGFHAA